MLEPAPEVAGEPLLCQHLGTLLALWPSMILQALDDHCLERRPGIAAVPLLASVPPV